MRTSVRIWWAPLEPVLLRTFLAICDAGSSGRLVELQLFGPSYPDNRAGLDETLTDVSWAPDPANEATWPQVSDWAK